MANGPDLLAMDLQVEEGVGAHIADLPHLVFARTHAQDAACNAVDGLGLRRSVRRARQIETRSRKKSRLLYYKQFSRILIFWHADCIGQPVGL